MRPLLGTSSYFCEVVVGAYCRPNVNLTPGFSPHTQLVNSRMRIAMLFFLPQLMHLIERTVSFCRPTSASAAPCTSRRMCCPMHCASYCASCPLLLRAFSGFIRSPPPTATVMIKSGAVNAKTEGDIWPRDRLGLLGHQ